MNEQGPDDEVLAKAHYVAGKQLFGMTEDVLWGGATEHAKQQSRYKARAVIASYLDQRAARGYVELRADVLLPLIKKYAESQYHIAIHEDRGTNAELKAATDARDAAWRGIISILAAHAPGATEEPI